MKHLKKVQLFRVGFDEKVSLEEKFFLQALVCNERPGIKNGNPRGCHTNSYKTRSYKTKSCKE
ncbi:Uncharacterised protein [Shewanella algae]|uniref:Uncharacterized protein n=1 Tax=Shewanella algae TaxID=38313 RepID=A0A380BE73_9GAMM|nr:Uncharacterised protein [Shewanella algae]